MAQVKNYGLIGVGTEIQLGKQGPKLKGNADSDTISVTNEGGSVLTTIEAANATAATHLVTKAQLDASATGSSGAELLLGASTDSSYTDGALQTLTTTTKISDGIDFLNEALENVRNDTFVKSRVELPVRSISPWVADLVPFTKNTGRAFPTPHIHIHIVECLVHKI